VDKPVTDRRTDNRDAPPDTVRATLRPGCSVRIVDLSAGGALVQGERPLGPGTRVHMHVVTSVQTFTLTARVLRCAVWALHPLDGVTYQGALQFENRCELFGEAGTQPGVKVPGTTTPQSPVEGDRIPASQNTGLRAYRGSRK
jgi:hypothetical protein